MGSERRRSWLVLAFVAAPGLACSQESLLFGRLLTDLDAGGRNEPSGAERSDERRTADEITVGLAEDGGFGADMLATSPPASEQPFDAGLVDIDPTLPTACQDVPSTPQLRFLSNRQYDNTIRDLLGIAALEDGNPPSSVLAPDHPDDINAEAWTAYQDVAEKLARQVVDTQALLAGVVKCDLTSEGDACLQRMVTDFGRRAFRRPLIAEEVDTFLGLIERRSELTVSGTPTEVAGVLLYAFLVAPSFLSRSEVNDVTDEQGRYLLTDYEVAQRLSYALWGSMPDATLAAAADRGELHTEDQIRAAAAIMLEDDRARDWSKWFHTFYVGAEGSLPWADSRKDAELFPQFPSSSSVLVEETLRFFDHVVFEQNGEFADLFLSPAAFVNRDTAPLYDLDPADYGETLTLTDVGAEARPGFLTRVGFLAGNSFPDRTFPSRRGAEVLRNVVGLEVPPDSLVEGPLGGDPLLDTVRKQLEFLSEPSSGCAACHGLTDPIGFVLEGFDAVGQVQTRDRRTGAPIDTRADVIVEQQGDERVTVSNPRELMVALLGSRGVKETYVRRWTEFLLEREPGEVSYCTTAELGARLTTGGYTIRDLLTDLLASEPFRERVPFD